MVKKQITGRTLAERCLRLGHERAIRKLALTLPSTTPVQIAELSFEEVCDIVAQYYTIFEAGGKEDFFLVKHDDWDEVTAKITPICR